MACDDKLISVLTTALRLIYQGHAFLWGNTEVFQTLFIFFNVAIMIPVFLFPPLPAQATLPSGTGSPASFDAGSPAENKGVREEGGRSFTFFI